MEVTGKRLTNVSWTYVKQLSFTNLVTTLRKRSYMTQRKYVLKLMLYERFVSAGLFSFRYQLWHLCDVLSWSVSLRYQLVRHYDVSNWSCFSTYQWDVANASQIGPSHSRNCCNVVMTSQHSPRRRNLYET